MSKFEKTLLALVVAFSIIIIVLLIVLSNMFIYYNFNKFIPTIDKFASSIDKFVPEIKQIDFARHYIGDGLFCIDGFRHHPALVITHGQTDVYEFGEILEGVIQFEFENEICYCYAEDGYAVVYPKSNLCKAFIISPSEALVEHFHCPRDEQNDYRIYKLSPDDHPENKYVVYLDSFDEFTEYEQKMLKELVRE